MVDGGATVRPAILHVSTDPADLVRALGSAAVLAAEPGWRVRVIVNGAALAGVHRDAAALEVPDDVEVVACRRGIAQRGWEPEDLQPRIGTVPAAIIALAEGQADGAVYIRI